MENKELYNLLDGFKSRGEAYKHFGLSDNSQSIRKLKNLAYSVGFDLKTYDNRRKPPIKYCKQCNKEFRHYGNIFCSRSCSAKHNNSQRKLSDETKSKISKSLQGRPHPITRHKENYKVTTKTKICKICGQEKCINKEICHHSQNWFYNLIPFSFDINSLRSVDVYKEYYRIKDLLLKEYFDNKLSPQDIKIKYQYDKNFENILHILKSFGIKTRNLSESNINACLNGKPRPQINDINTKYQYKHGWHITWNNKRIYYRSSYELKFAKKLDNNKIDYETEYFRIKYWDSQLLKYRVAIPDFYIINENKIIEVKSRVTFNKQNIIDKFKEYIKIGFDVLLIYETKEYSFDEIQNINECDYILGKENAVVS